jgi:hypothetical protein
MTRKLICVLALLGAMLVCSVAHGRSLPHTNRGYDTIPAKFVDLGFDNTLLLRWFLVGDTASFEADYLPSVHFRFFALKNMGISLHIGGFVGYGYQSVEGEVVNENQDLGFTATVMVNYYLGIANTNLFWKPGIGGGFFYGNRDVADPAAPGRDLEHSLIGGIIRVDLGFTFYAGPNWNLSAGPDLILRLGSATAQDGSDDGSFFTSLHGGFSAGFGYTW